MPKVFSYGPKNMCKVVSYILPWMKDAQIMWNLPGTYRLYEIKNNVKCFFFGSMEENEVAGFFVFSQ